MGYGAQRNTQNPQIAHLWAHQREDGITHNKGKNFYREGKTIYSYGSHFPIASIDDRNGKKTVFFTTRTYSNTTSAHIGEVHSACSHLEKIYCRYPNEAIAGIHSDNLYYWENEANDRYNDSLKAKFPGKYYRAIESLRENLSKYCKYWKLTKKNNATLASFKYIWIKPTKKQKELFAEHDKKQAEIQEKAQETRDRKRKEREAIWAESNRIWKAQEVQKKETAKIIGPKVIEAWRSNTPYIGQGLPGEGLKEGELWKVDSYDLRNYFDNINTTIIRANTDTGNIETSKHIEIPFEVAHRFYKWLKQQLKNGGCNGDCKHEILGYEVKTVNHDGFIVGCHNVLWTETEAIARKLNW